MKLVTWNIAGREAAWRYLLESDADIGLLQEATQPPADIFSKVGVDGAEWTTVGAGKNRQWRAAIVNVSNKYNLDWIEAKSIEMAKPGELAVSRLGSLSAAKLTMSSGEKIIIVSVYAVWEEAHSEVKGSWIFSDASVHRIISDLSVFIGNAKNHKVIVTGDFNTLFGYGEHGDTYWAARFETVFSRMKSLGLEFMGLQAPNGRVADPWPDELPKTSKNVPTFYHNRQKPSTATRQLDYVFASSCLKDRLSVTALNEVDLWGPSDHCRVELELT
jgi:exonuclease III